MKVYKNIADRLAQRSSQKENNFMPIAIKSIGAIIGTIMAVLALIIAVLKGVLGLISFITLAIKVLVIGLFVAVFLIIGLMVFRTLRDSRKSKE